MGESKERRIDSSRFVCSFEQWKRQFNLGPETSSPVQAGTTGIEKLSDAGTVKMTPPEPPGQPIVSKIEFVLPSMGSSSVYPARRIENTLPEQPNTSVKTAETTLPHDILAPVRGFLRRFSWPARILAGVATASVPGVAAAAGPASEPGSESAVAEAAAKAFANQTRQVLTVPLSETHIDLKLAGLLDSEQLDIQAVENVIKSFGSDFFEKHKDLLISAGLDIHQETDLSFEVVTSGDIAAIQFYTSEKNGTIYRIVGVNQGGETEPGFKGLILEDLTAKPEDPQALRLMLFFVDEQGNTLLVTTEKGVVLAQAEDAFDDNGALTPEAVQQVNGILPSDLTSSGGIIGVGQFTIKPEDGKTSENASTVKVTQGVLGLRFTRETLSRAKIAQPETAEMSNNITASLHTKETAPTGKFVQSLNVRKGPGTDYERVGSIKQADVVEVLGRDEQTGWGKVKLSDGTIGFVNLSYLGLAEGTQLPTISSEEIASITKAQPEAVPEVPKEQPVEQAQQPQQPETKQEGKIDFSQLSPEELTAIQRGERGVDLYLQLLIPKFNTKDFPSKYPGITDKFSGLTDSEIEFVLGAIRQYFDQLTPDERQRAFLFPMIGSGLPGASVGDDQFCGFSWGILGRQGGLNERNPAMKAVIDLCGHEPVHYFQKKNGQPISEPEAEAVEAEMSARLGY